MARAIILAVASPISVLVPDFEGQVVIDTVADTSYTAVGLTHADWVEGGGGGGGGASTTEVILPEINDANPSETIIVSSAAAAYRVDDFHSGFMGQLNFDTITGSNSDFKTIEVIHKNSVGATDGNNIQVNGVAAQLETASTSSFDTLITFKKTTLGYTIRTSILN